jgi:hypothetical protein
MDHFLIRLKGRVFRDSSMSIGFEYWYPSKRCGGDGAGFELTIDVADDPAATRLGW